MSRVYDLHIHSCLSPCADDDMTPENIAGMAHINKLDTIALTDHNSGENLEVTAAACAKYDIRFVPGVEVNTAEEIHVLCYFSALSSALSFCDMIYDSLPDIPNRPEIFGNQLIIGKDDAPAGSLNKMLYNASAYPLEDVVALSELHGGCAVPAHINRQFASLMANIGYIPDGLFSAVEIRPELPAPDLPEGMKVLYSSDAHQLQDIAAAAQAAPSPHPIGDIIRWLE